MLLLSSSEILIYLVSDLVVEIIYRSTIVSSPFVCNIGYNAFAFVFVVKIKIMSQYTLSTCKISLWISLNKTMT